MMNSDDTKSIPISQPSSSGVPRMGREGSSARLRPAQSHKQLADYLLMTRHKEGWLEKRSVSAAVVKNWRRRYLIVWDDRICWYRDAPREGCPPDEPAGYLLFGAGTAVKREPSRPSLVSITSAGRVLMVRGSEEEMVAWNDAICRRAHQSSNSAAQSQDVGSGTRTSRARRNSAERAGSFASLDLAPPRPVTTPRPSGAIPPPEETSMGRADSWQRCCLSTPRDAPTEDGGFQTIL